jgi:nitroreductase
MEVLKEILVRRSIRQFKTDPVEKDKIERILEAGRLAPSAKNRQEWRFIVIQKQEIRERVKMAAYGQEWVGRAPVIIAVCTTNTGYRMPNGQLSHPIDLSFAAAFMTLQCVREGLGSCCLSTFDEEDVKNILSVPYSMKIVLLLVMGYADEQPEAGIRKPLRTITAYNHW